MRIVICTGSRGWQNGRTIRDALDSIARPFVIVVGDAPGADAIFWQSGVSLQLPRFRFLADWQNLGKKAGVLRNQRMVSFGQIHRKRGNEVFALAAWDGRSPGTADCIGRLTDAMIDIWRIRYDH